MTQQPDPTVPHPSFADLLKRYEICDDAFEGDVREYVPALPDQNKNEYQDYVNRPAYFNVVGPTTTALVGAMTRKEYVLNGYAEFPANDLKSGNAFIAANLRDLLLGARVGILVTVENGQSKLVSYDADDILNWSDTFIVLKECQLVPDAKNPFLQVEQESWLELYLEDGVFQSRRWYKSSKGKFVVDELETLTINGQPLGFIPFFVATPFDNTWDVFTPPLYTQASLNIQHFKQAVDLAHYAHWMAIPTFTIAGDLATYTDDTGASATAEVLIGSTKKALHLTQGSSASFTEVSGASFGMLQTEMSKVEERMFISGARLISNKRGVESAEALQLRSGSESATLETIVTALEGALNGALEVCGMIDRVPNASIELNRDFTAAVLDSGMVSSLLSLLTAGAITPAQFQERLIQGEVVSPESTK